MKFTYSNDKIYRHIKLNLNDIDGFIFIDSNLNISDIWKIGISFDMNEELVMTFAITNSSKFDGVQFVYGYKELKNIYPMVDFSNQSPIDYVLYNINDTKLIVSVVFENEDFTMLYLVSENGIDSYYDTLQEAINYFNKISILD